MVVDVRAKRLLSIDVNSWASSTSFVCNVLDVYLVDTRSCSQLDSVLFSVYSVLTAVVSTPLAVETAVSCGVHIVAIDKVIKTKQVIRNLIGLLLG